MLKVLQLLVIALLISGCDPNQCGFPIGKSCDDDPKCCGEGGGGGGGNGGGQSSTYWADCICKSGSTLSAHFYSKPLSPPQIGQSVTVQATNCKWLSACEPNPAVTGTFRMKVSTWNYNTALIYKYKLVGSLERSSLLQTPRPGFASVLDPLREQAAEGKLYLIAQKKTDDQCAIECSEFTPYCGYVFGAKGSEIQKDLSTLQIMVSRQGFIKKQEIMDLFNQTADPCNRTGIELSDGFVRNEGNACELSAKGQLAGSDIGVTIALPPRLAGEYQITGNEIEVNFPSHDEAGKMSLTPPEIDSEYGGFIEKVSASPDLLVFTTETGCLGVPLK